MGDMPLHIVPPRLAFKHWMRLFPGSNCEDDFKRFVIFNVAYMSLDNGYAIISYDGLRALGLPNTVADAKEIAAQLGAEVIDHNHFLHLATRIILDPESALKILNDLKPAISDPKGMAKLEKLIYKRTNKVLTDIKERELNRYIDALSHSIYYPDSLLENVKSRITQLKKEDQSDRKIKLRIMKLQVAQALIENKSTFYNPSSLPYMRLENGIQHINSVDRRAITPYSENYREIDLTAAHLSIIAGGLGILPPLDWSTIRAELIERSGLEKEQIKRYLNCALYGAGERMRAAQLEPDDSIREIYIKELDRNIGKVPIPLDLIRLENQLAQTSQMIEILSRIKSIKDAIIKDRGMYNAFGTFVSYDDIEGKYEHEKHNSVLSCICSSFEKYLMLPLVEHARYKGISIVIEQHDGMTIWCQNVKRLDSYLLEAKDILAKAAAKASIKTDISIKNLA